MPDWSKMEYVPMTTLQDLDVGDVVRHKIGGNAYVVTGNYGTHVTAVRTVDLTNPPEWLVLRARRE